jgi:hypothetical protein
MKAVLYALRAGKIPIPFIPLARFFYWLDPEATLQTKV